MKKKNTENDQISQAIKITELEASNQALVEKLKLLRIQLQSQTQFEYAARTLRSRSASLNRSRNNLSTPRNVPRSNAMKPVTAKSYDSIYHELNILQEEFENVKKQHRDHISELENKITKSVNLSPTKLKNELEENIELINLKRFSKKQAAQIQSLESDLEVAKSEIKQLKIELTSITTSKDNLQSELSKEKSEIVRLNADLSVAKENNKLLEEQLKDLQVEKETLKEHNGNLLNLSLRRESAVENADSRMIFLRQIRELEEDLKRENTMRTDLTSKAAEAEFRIAKLTSTMADLQSTNTSLKEELENLREKLVVVGVEGNQSKSSRTQDKSVMTLFEDDSAASSNVGIEPDSKLRLYQTERELSQCKELLRVQYNLNNKYKQEIEELQVMFQRNEKSNSDHVRNFQLALRNHQEKLTRTANQLRNNNLHSTLAELKNFFATKKSNSFQDFICIISKLLDGYILCLESADILTSHAYNKKDASVDASINRSEKSVQAEIIVKSAPIMDNDVVSEISEIDSSSLLIDSDSSYSVIFELRIEKATFSFFSDHLKKSSQNNPKIFLTWNFLNDNEHQAYTPTISVTEGVFNCTCQYEGPWSHFLHQYLKENGIRIEIHLVQGDITVRLAETVIHTSSALDKPNTSQTFRSPFKNDNIEGDVTGNYVLKCDPALCALFS